MIAEKPNGEVYLCCGFDAELRAMEKLRLLLLLVAACACFPAFAARVAAVIGTQVAADMRFHRCDARKGMML